LSLPGGSPDRLPGKVWRQVMKEKITNIIKDYRLLFGDEFKAFGQAMRTKQKEAKDKFGQIGKTDYIERKIWEMPVTLYEMFEKQLTEDEFNQFFRSQSNKLTVNQKWFLKTYPVFKSPEKL
jgi:hypothetical protein